MMKMQLHVLGMTRFKMDNGQEFATLFALEETSAKEQDKLGSVAMECKTGYDLIDRCKDFSFPNDFNAEVELVAGSKKKTTLMVHSLQPLTKAKP